MIAIDSASVAAAVSAGSVGVLAWASLAYVAKAQTKLAVLAGAAALLWGVLPHQSNAVEATSPSGNYETASSDPIEQRAQAIARLRSQADKYRAGLGCPGLNKERAAQALNSAISYHLRALHVLDGQMSEQLETRSSAMLRIEKAQLGASHQEREYLRDVLGYHRIHQARTKARQVRLRSFLSAEA